MKKYCLLILIAAIVLPAGSFAKKTTYITTNHRFNWVKISEVKASVAEARKMTQPATIDEEGLRSALKAVKFSRTYIIKKEVDAQDVFDENAINFLAPNLVKAFSTATDKEEVIFSYLMKNPIIILRNDRINLGKMWISGSELHIVFEKLYAKVLGDVDKRGNEAKAVANARGLRVQLDLQPGQMLGVSDPDEVILDLNFNYAAVANKPEAPKPTVTKTMSGKEVPISQPTAGSAEAAAATVAAEAGSPAPQQDAKLDKKKAKEMAKADKKAAENQAAAQAEPAVPTVQDRLNQLDQLKKSGLITDKEYQEKRKEILKAL